MIRALAFLLLLAPSAWGQSAQYGPPGYTPYTATGATTARASATRFADTANVLDFGADSTGTNDSAAAFTAAISKGRDIYVPAGTYLICSTITAGNVHLYGEGAKLSILKGCASSAPSSPVLLVGGSSVVENLKVTYETSAITDGETTGERACISSLDNSTAPFALQRGSTLRNLFLTHCGTGIYGSTSATVFSATFDAIEISDFSYRGFDLESANRTGSVFRNIYITNGRTNADRGFSLSGGGSEDRLDQINVENSVLNYSMAFEYEKGLSIGTLHLEGGQQRNPNTGFVLFANSTGKVDAFVALNTRMNLTGGAVIEIGTSDNANSSFSNLDGNRLDFDEIYTQGLNWPDSVLYPGYLNKGLNNVVGYALIYRSLSALNSYTLSVNHYLWANYDGAQDATYYQNPPINQNANITVERWVAFPGWGPGSTYLSAQTPDNTTTGGNARGAGSFDNQRSRTLATQVASGAQSVILGGQNNTASGTGSLSSGFFALAQGDFSGALGQGAQTAKNYSWSFGKDSADVGNYGTWAFGSGFFATAGDAQTTTNVLRVATSASSARLTADAAVASTINTLNFWADNMGFGLSCEMEVTDTASHDTATLYVDHLNVTRKTGAGSVVINGVTTPIALTVANAQGTLSGAVSASATADTTSAGVNISIAQTGALSLRAVAVCRRTWVRS